MCYSIEENVWRERRTIQLNVKGIRFEPHPTLSKGEGFE
jgi:single-stranded-DNA-specific exonuclease